ncbi:MAG TPA: beta-galactosidase [Fimbriimonas sp.]|nr:beta-galactosidase [Fimbriimonas sp.]
MDTFLYGGDYNPDQWPRETWLEDMRLMKEANWNIASLPIFGWAALEPKEGHFTFEWLDEILGLMAENGIRACLATATASVPAWLPQSYSDVLVVDENGQKRKHGNRHTFCPNSPNYHRLSTRLAREIATRYKDHPALLLWHINNEYGTYCYCDRCAHEFRHWLQHRYEDLDDLNRRWYTSFWGHMFSSWDQIEPPTFNGERSMQALRLDYYRFQSESLLNCFKAEAAVLREVTPEVQITTNLMGHFYPLDYHEWAKEMDVVSWDNYPRADSQPDEIAFTHALMRGLKEGQPFLLMEQSPSQANWHAYNRLKPPGQLRLFSMQAVANGADSVMYFQWRRGRGGAEKLHGAVVEHGGTNQNRVFKEVSALGAELQTLTQIQGQRVPAKVALLFSWENWWDLTFSSGPSKDLDYVKVVKDFYAAFYEHGIQVEVLSPQADLKGYDLIVAPLLMLLREEDAARIAQHVQAGATLVTTVFSALVDENDNVHANGAPGPWRKLLGIFGEEADALHPGEDLPLLPSPLGEGLGVRVCKAHLLAERVQLEGAETLLTYGANFYRGEPSLTVNHYGEGKAYYFATLPTKETLANVLKPIWQERGIEPPIDAPGVEVTQRGEWVFLLNHSDDTKEVDGVQLGPYDCRVLPARRSADT